MQFESPGFRYHLICIGDFDAGRSGSDGKSILGVHLHHDVSLDRLPTPGNNSDAHRRPIHLLRVYHGELWGHHSVHCLHLILARNDRSKSASGRSCLRYISRAQLFGINLVYQKGTAAAVCLPAVRGNNHPGYWVHRQLWSQSSGQEA